MSQGDPERDLRNLIAAHLADDLSDAQRSHLNELLRTDENARSLFAAAMRQVVLLGEVLREEASRREATPGPSHPPASVPQKASGEQKTPTRGWAARPLDPPPRGPSWIGLLVAAGVLGAAATVWVLGSSSAPPAISQKGAEIHPRASKEIEERRGAERDLALAEAKHRDAMERLKEIERKSLELSQPLTLPLRNPVEEERLTQKRVELQSEKERVQQVEREMREAIERARISGRPVPTDPARGETPAPPPESAAVTQRPPTQLVVARVDETAGLAFLVAKDGKTPATPGMNLLPTQGLETGGGASRLVLRFPDKTRAELGPETLLGEIKTESGKHLWVAKGTLLTHVVPQPKDQPMILATPHGQAKVVGTTLRVIVDPDPRKGMRLEVEEGKVELMNGAGKTVLVEGGHYAVAAEGVDLVARREDAATPVPRSGLAVWLRADQGVSLSGSGGVATWADRSGNKHDAVQPGAAQQPTLIPLAVQGHPAVRFDGVDDCMSFPCPVTGLGGMTLFLVSSTLEERGAPDHGANAALYWQETATCSGVLLNPSQSKIWCYFGTGQIQPLIVYSRPTPLGRGYSLTTAQKSGPELMLFVNGLEALRLRGQKPAIGSNEKVGQIGRGEGDQVTNRQFQGQREGWTYFSGEIAELIVYTRALGDIERKSIEQYLLGKYFSK